MKNFVHDLDFVYLKENCLLDCKKNLFRIKINENVQMQPIAILKKSISIITIYNDIIYICDRFGDIYTIKEKPQLIFGNLCFTTSMVINEKIWTGDKYGRIRISDFYGKIEKYLFLEDQPIYEMNILENYIYVSTKNKIVIINVETYETKYLNVSAVIRSIKYKDSLFCITENKLFKIRNYDQIKEEILNYKFIDGIFYIDKFYMLTDDGKIFCDNKLILDLKASYTTNYKILNPY